MPADDIANGGGQANEKPERCRRANRLMNFLITQRPLA